MNLGTNKMIFYDKLGIHQLEITEEEKDPAILLGHGFTMNWKHLALTKPNCCSVKSQIKYYRDTWEMFSSFKRHCGISVEYCIQIGCPLLRKEDLTSPCWEGLLGWGGAEEKTLSETTLKEVGSFKLAECKLWEGMIAVWKCMVGQTAEEEITRLKGIASKASGHELTINWLNAGRRFLLWTTKLWKHFLRAVKGLKC